MKRLFIAIEIPENVKQNLLTILDKYASDRINRVPKNNMHITVQFLGDIEEGSIKKIEKKLESIVENIEPFYLNVENIIFAPPRKIKNMIWATLGENNGYKKIVEKTSTNLKFYIDKNITSKNKNIMRKQRIPHITLARFKDPMNVDGINFNDIDIQKDKFEVNCISLWESKLSNEGAKYQILNRFNFK